jgi:hypothetical protein
MIPAMDFPLRQAAVDAMNTKGTLTDKEKSNQPYLPELDAFLKVTFSAHIDSDFRRAVKFHGRSWNQAKKRCKKNTPAPAEKYDFQVHGRPMEEVIKLVTPVAVFLQFGTVAT